MCRPTFKYHPNAYELDIFIHEEGECSVCNQLRHLKYSADFYSDEEPEYICPWCIANGLAAEKFAGSFNDYIGVEVIPKDKLDEVLYRTPSYISWQQQVWLSHCNEPCAFLAYVGAKEILPFWDELIKDIEQQELSADFVKANLSKDGDMIGYLFECLHCSKKRLHIDLN